MAVAAAVTVTVAVAVGPVGSCCRCRRHVCMGCCGSCGSSRRGARPCALYMAWSYKKGPNVLTPCGLLCLLYVCVFVCVLMTCPRCQEGSLLHVCPVSGDFLCARCRFRWSVYEDVGECLPEGASVLCGACGSPMSPGSQQCVACRTGFGRLRLKGTAPRGHCTTCVPKLHLSVSWPWWRWQRQG